ncbi:MAG: GNAT family N-acetyltransferase [Flavobacteriaceae bacterium]|nr:GNAT family N-acetyltransferase [Flavobacteriaceae bacterium]
MNINSIIIKPKKWVLKTFDELNNNELYGILRLRNSIFIIDQQCIFEDIDGKDVTDCYHFFCSVNGQIIAYARFFGPSKIYNEPCLSRVCTSLDQRGKGIGKELMKRALDKMSILFPKQSFRIEAQLYLKFFYESFGFKVVGETYIEDGIEHVHMLK